jgi:hypothetical protein
MFMRTTLMILVMLIAAEPAFARSVPIPEPASMTLLGVGLATMLIARRGKK